MLFAGLARLHRRIAYGRDGQQHVLDRRDSILFPELAGLVVHNQGDGRRSLGDSAYTIRVTMTLSPYKLVSQENKERFTMRIYMEGGGNMG